MTNKAIHTYKDLVVWQRAVELVVAVYELTEKFPKEEVYGLTSQMRRTSPRDDFAAPEKISFSSFE